ncbi:MAG: cupin domain-containing protein [Desulfobacterales bacterium]
MTFLNLKDIEEKEPVPGFKVRFIHSENMTFAHWEIEKDSSLPAHSHPHEQVTHVLEGKFELTIGDETRVLTSDMGAVIPPNVPHSGRAITECRIIDTFCPVREDYRFHFE